MRTFFLLLVTLWASVGAGAAETGPAVETGHATSRLVSLNDGFVPGETNWIALYQQLDDGWHVYWENPGDSGLPLELDWTLPEGFAAGEVVYPEPHRLEIGPLVNFGHEGTPVFLVPLDVPADAPLGLEVRLSVEASWLICLDICLPEQATLTMTAPIAAQAAFEPSFGGLVEDALAVRPTEPPFEARYFGGPDGPGLILSADLADPEFFPEEPNLIEPSGRQIVSANGGDTLMWFDAGFAWEDDHVDALEGVLVAGIGEDRRSYVIEAQRTAAPASAAPIAAAAQGSSVSQGPGVALGYVLLLAFVGGIVLNVMPCVFPVVFMKAAALAKTAHEDRAVQRRHGWLYLLGVLATFTALAGALIVLRAAGEQVGWGFQLQNPVVVGLFAIVIFLVGLNLAGLFEVGGSVQGVGQGLAAKQGGAGAFFTGVLAVAVAAPCIGPFLGVPIGYALSQPPAAGLSVFVVMGLGLALPFLLLSLVPALGRVLPKPGPWMTTAKELLSFAMFGTLVWLAWVLSLQTGAAGVLALGIALVLAGFAAWAFGRVQKGGGAPWRAVAAAALLAAFVPLLQVEPVRAQGDLAAGDLTAVPYDEAVLAEFRAAGTPVFVDFTAAWCVTCQVNKQAVLKRDEVVSAFAEAGARYMVADWTVRDPVITAALERHGRSGVPLYLYYAPGAEEARILPQVLSVDGVTGLFEETV